MRAPSGADAELASGTLEAAGIARLVASGALSAPDGILPEQVQPASLDLRLGTECWRMPGSTLPLGAERIRDLVAQLALERIDLTATSCLARNQVYIVRLAETLALEPGLEAYCNGKSSTGRVDVATRVLADGSPRYDRIPPGYHGELWIELIPRSFHVLVRAGVSLNQAIFFRSRSLLDQAQLLARHRASPLLYGPDRAPAPASSLFDGRLVMSADLDRDPVGFVAKRTHLPLDLGRVRQHAAEDFFAPVERPRSGFLFLEQDRFYILATSERVVVPADLACEMVPFDPTAGEFRAHYAGFFDPGWGCAPGDAGLPAVLEVRAHEDDLVLRHSQPICAMAFERLATPCTRLYGTANNTYAGQDGPRLSKHFSQAPPRR
jgi:dCTP deaminase